MHVIVFYRVYRPLTKVLNISETHYVGLIRMWLFVCRTTVQEYDYVLGTVTSRYFDVVISVEVTQSNCISIWSVPLA